MSLIDNKRAGFDYSIIETMEAGLVFEKQGKSSRGRGSLKGARVVARGGEAYLVGATIPHLQAPANAPKDYDPERTRKLLLNKKQIAQVLSAEGKHDNHTRFRCIISMGI